jgi:hypothetical protein
MEQLLQAVSNTLVGNQGDGKMVSVGGGKVTLQCGSCDYSTQPIRPKKARHRLAQHRKVFHTEVVVIPDQVEGGHLAVQLVQGGDFESPYLVEEPVHESLNLVEVPVYEVPYLVVVGDTIHQEIFMSPNFGEENVNSNFAGAGGNTVGGQFDDGHPGEEVRQDLMVGSGVRGGLLNGDVPDTGFGAIVDREIIYDGHTGEGASQDLLYGDGEESHRGGDSEHGFRDAGGGGTVDRGQVNAGHPGEEHHDDLLFGDGGNSLHGEVRVITVLGGDIAGDGGTVDGGIFHDGHPGEAVHQDLRGEVRGITDLGGDDAGGGGNIEDNQTVVGGNITDGHWEPGTTEHPDLRTSD